jgi:hypothetical protein
MESLAEEYCLGRLDRTAADQLLMHCATCKYCSQLFRETREYVRAMQAAARQISDHQ